MERPVIVLGVDLEGKFTPLFVGTSSVEAEQVFDNASEGFARVELYRYPEISKRRKFARPVGESAEEVEKRQKAEAKAAADAAKAEAKAIADAEKAAAKAKAEADKAAADAAKAEAKAIADAEKAAAKAKAEADKAAADASK